MVGPPSVRRLLNNQIVGYVSAISIPTIFYIARRTVGAAGALVVVQRTLQTFEVAPVGREVLERAAGMPGSDYEDNVQTASAIAVNADVIVTRDQSGFVGSSVRVMAPTELEAELSARP